MDDTLLIKNCLFYDKPDAGKQNILIKNGKMVGLGVSEENNVSSIYDAGGRIVAPGFIDLHIHGAGGADVGDGNLDSLKKMSKTLARYGVTSFLATTMLEPDTDNQHLKVLKNGIKNDRSGANILGVHLEGPFISPEMRRGIPKRAIFRYSPDKLHEIQDLLGNKLKMMTIAPEIKGGIKLIKDLKSNNIVPALGHTNATYEETKKAFDAGMDHVTHIFNAMPALHHRQPGPLLAIFESETSSAQIISDGVHLNPNIVNYLYKTLGNQRCICITDGIQAIGLPDGRYKYYGREYIKKEGTARYLDGTLIGTTLDTGTIAFKFKEFTGCTMKDAIATVTKNPANVLGIQDKKGSLEKGKDADLVMLNNDHTVYATFVGGELVYQQK
jgi:N-acetylglucosamine-6-phosphate deacetylase